MSLARSVNTGALTTSTKKNSNLILVLICLVVGLGMGAVIAYLIVNGLWQFALGLIFALPAFVLIHRYPFVGLLMWLALAPLVMSTEGGVMRRVFWIIHRALPLITVAIVYLSSWLHFYKRKLPRLGLAEIFMLGYVIATELSIIYLNDSVMPTTYIFYDRVVVPMLLYLVIRLINPDEQRMRRLIPVLIFVLLVQSIVGVMSWTIPGALPSAWQGSRIGTRTTGTFDAYSVFSATVMFCGLFIVHKAFNDNLSTKVRQVYMWLFGLSLIMIFFSFSRGSWLAGVLVLVILGITYKKEMTQFALVAIPVGMLVISLGFLSEYTEWANQRLSSESSENAALSRLPIMYASLGMFAAKPVFGWGFGNFDKYDRQFQGRVGDIVNAEKDHASHNVYLTLIAEQGIIGVVFFLFPVFWWLWLSVKAWPLLPKEGFWSRKLLVILWAELLFHVIVNNFSNMRVVYGLGIWWVTLALIATYINPYFSTDYVREVSGETDEVEAKLKENRSRSGQVLFLLRHGRDRE
jgi:O-antigen ligase